MLNPNQFQPTGDSFQSYVDDQTNSWPLSHGGTGGNVGQQIVVERSQNGRWGGFVHSARYDTDRSGEVGRMYDSDAETRADDISTPRGRSSFRTAGRAAVVGHAMAPGIARQHAEPTPNPY